MFGGSVFFRTPRSTPTLYLFTCHSILQISAPVGYTKCFIYQLYITNDILSYRECVSVYKSAPRIIHGLSSSGIYNTYANIHKYN